MPDISLVNLGAYALVVTLLVITPGADVMLVVSSALRGRASAGLLTAIGICAGAFVWAILAGIGLVAVLVANPTVFDVLTLAGVGYMFYIGYIEIKAGLARSSKSKEAVAATETSNAGYIRKGLVTNLLNPKVGIFYIAFLPQFIESGSLNLGNVMFLGGIHIVIGFVFLGLCSVFIDWAQSLLQNPRIADTLMIFAGVVIILLALGVLWSRFIA